MKLMFIEYWKQKRRSSDRHNRKAVQSKKLEYRISIETKEILEKQLEKNDRVMLEVNPSVLSEFINILSDRSLSMYEFEQVDKNKFIFSNKEIIL